MKEHGRVCSRGLPERQIKKGRPRPDHKGLIYQRKEELILLK
jgi:hypothetical protein